ncbi:hypothetical protein FACS189442_3480 [Spirochaetia bacterium]|nr:hypothetical protein FACS189442_3480 [Spirochaetia bacterium]
MKRNDLLKILAQQGVVLFRHGGGHDIYINEKTGKKVSVPRHSEIGNKMVKVILKELGK